MDPKSTNIDALSGKCLLTDKDWVKSSSGSIATTQKTMPCGSLSKMISSPNGDLVIGDRGGHGYEITESSFHDKGWE